jgi:hypothetical protein
MRSRLLLTITLMTLLSVSYVAEGANRFKFAQGTYLADTITSVGPFTLTNSISLFKLSVMRAGLPDTPNNVDVFGLRSWVSHDSGQTWFEGAGMTVAGGDVYEPGTGGWGSPPGPLATESSVEWTIYPQQGGAPQRQIRMEIETFIEFEMDGEASWR